MRSRVVRSGPPDGAGHTAPTMRARLDGSIAGAVVLTAALLTVPLLSAACAAPIQEASQTPPAAAAGSLPPTPPPPAPRLTYNPAQWPNPLDPQWLGGRWMLIAAAPAPRIEPLRYFLDFGQKILVTDEDGKPLTWLGGVRSVEWSDPRGTWTVHLTAPEPCGDATYSVTIRGGLLFAPIDESCRERFGVLVVDAWSRVQPTASKG